MTWSKSCPSEPDMPCLDQDRVLWPLRSYLVLEFSGFENGLKEQAGSIWGYGGGNYVQEKSLPLALFMDKSWHLVAWMS